MKELYFAPACYIYQFVEDGCILSVSDGTGSGSNMDDGDYTQNPF